MYVRRQNAWCGAMLGAFQEAHCQSDSDSQKFHAMLGGELKYWEYYLHYFIRNLIKSCNNNNKPYFFTSTAFI